ncbi:DNA polymerase IV [Georgfuchsia toluolica]|uniref:DNA polymerase IV n=2 Tax=Georgfuchsia toluolica TaxID=424218 RepID=A0A916MZY3_9PROT|nr:DNA polymerase IV [Georgfuchsia toluolica]
MDAFFASVELLTYPELRGQPVVVGGGRDHQPQVNPDGTHEFARIRNYKGRGVITTSTYEARALGVFSGMGVMKAVQLAPDAILLPVNFDAYRYYSRLFKEAVATIAPQIENRGIDEIYIDLTDMPGETLDLARRIKQAVKEATELTCSIGITPNKLLSKICSDLQKPDGITILGMEDIPSRIWPLPVRKINGIGPKATEKLAGLGITTIGELAAAELELLQIRFGRSYGSWLHDAANGIDNHPVVTHSEPKSISRETTFERDLHPRQDRDALSEIFTALCVRVAEDLKRKGYLGRTIGIKLRFEDFQTVTRDITLPDYTAEPAQIRRAAGECLRRVPLDKKIRLLGVRVSALQQADNLRPAQESPQQDLPFSHLSSND